MFITLQPAFGRDYKSQAAVKKDWNSGKDFIITQIGHPHDGRYANKSDMAGSGNTVNIRYDQNRKVLPIECN